MDSPETRIEEFLNRTAQRDAPKEGKPSGRVTGPRRAWQQFPIDEGWKEEARRELIAIFTEY